MRVEYGAISPARGATSANRFEEGLPVFTHRDEIEVVYRSFELEPRQFAGIGDHWAPYRSWVALLLRTRREEKAGPGARGRSVR
jgi:3-methyladenine DNA glycosylase/8-oxoguanine DNA glycosylase